ncbi:M23 family metallopeptidase [Streptomyces sp. NPDC088354]|uniref:M23 family metallopeptidase n=1 Tax=unclassified Streptomyces TaxID=2593676 RepID=UPI0029AC96E3|nr:M23 family metallopeptidase [Streptomyces sp. MI02-7b]MDX3076567.1 M23 family metallopeptidase [Streptomyces sp. MI02-7b]
MLKPDFSNSVIRGRGAAVTAGVVASLALGAVGTASAATQDAGLLGMGAAGKLAKATRAQADGQQRAAVAGQADRHARTRLHATHVARLSVAWMKPVKHYQLSAGYMKNGAHWAHKHSGQDFAVAIGTDVHAVHSGTVVTAGWGGAYGNNIVIRHSDNTYSQYGHLSKIKVRVGEHVNTGEEIALSGNTGNSTGPHLHFEIRTTPYYGSSVSPLPFLRAEGVSV